MPPLRWAAMALCLATVSSAALAAPDVRILKGKHATIPFETRDQHIRVRGRIQGADSVWIVVDTGASASCLDLALARKLGLRELSQHEAHGAGGPQAGINVADATLELPGLVLQKREMGALALAGIGAAGAQAMGAILGSELFMHHVVVVDYATRTLDVWDPAAFPWPKDGFVVPMTLDRNLPYIDGALLLPGRERLPGRFVIDTGSAMALLLSSSAAQRENVVAAFPRTLELMGRGVGGPLKNDVGRADAFEFGKARLEHPIVVVPQAGHVSAEGTLGNIGGQILRRFRVTFDYGRKRILFQPNEALNEPFETDMSGATFTYAPEMGVVRIVRVAPDTPAAEGGLREGDVIESLDGEAIHSIGYAEFRERLKQDGRELALGVRRGAQKLNVALRLRRLI